MTEVTVTTTIQSVEVNSSTQVVEVRTTGVQGPPGPPGDGTGIDPDLVLLYIIARDT